MTETQATEPAADEAHLRQRLVRRVGIAGVSIIALIAGLAIFDANQKPEPPVVAVAPKPPTPAPAPVTPAEPPSATEEKPAEPSKAPQKEIASAPEESSNPAASALQDRPLTKPATARPASIKPTAPAAPPEPAKVVEKTGRPLSSAAQATEARARHYVVQMGVFSNLANAEELRSRLDKAGVASQIEARVQVGPFNTRAEAEAAQKKLQALGLDTGMLVSAKK